ncbi:MAG: DUF928 domain-containing protein [Cyanobacteria bacterium CRU_2_1]|nr:DUF928 domain-containing protein [Cyanobacteria bacterium RU_5_0]NJR61694.1 DUF928 domain-containing protein [Cyanobacteria bacterium CRU_2_1]
MKRTHSIQFHSRLQLNRLVLSLTLTCGLVLGGLPIAAAQTYVPTNRGGLPGRREGGGTRGGCPISGAALTSLSPNTNFGTTTTEYPTFFWYVPSTSPIVAEFVLLDEDDEEVYSAMFQITGESGVISLSLPPNANLPPLEIGKDYRWFFFLICDPTDRSGDIYTAGWIQRVAPDPVLVSQIEAAPPTDRPALYAKASIWYDAIASLADLRRTQPDDPALLEQWQTLLGSIDLSDLADEPLVQCCEPPVR